MSATTTRKTEARNVWHTVDGPAVNSHYEEQHERVLD